MSEDTKLPESINNRYTVKKLLGRGGMGQVLLVEDTQRDGLEMALKTMLPDRTDDLLTAGFRDEFAELAKLEHPNLAKAYDFGRIAESGEYFFTTEFVRGVELIDAIGDTSLEQMYNIMARSVWA
ncbi:MAG: hypothetical protein AAF517_03385, partial [Planctomycetota bacterium]